MGLFNKKNEGGLMDAIRCDESDYLVWKWRPKGMEVNSTKKENAIRYGSSLNVKDGEESDHLNSQRCFWGLKNQDFLNFLPVEGGG